MLTQTQREEREGRLGSSDAPAVAGVSPYTSPRTLYHQMRGELPRYSETETERQMWGSRLEPVVAAVAAERLGANAWLGDGARLGDGAWLGDGAEVGTEARVGTQAVIGAQARVGTQAVIGAQARVGDGAQVEAWTQVEAEE